MTYKLNVTEHANQLLGNIIYHLIYCLKNMQAAKHLLDSIDTIYDRLELNPFQFPECRDAYLTSFRDELPDNQDGFDITIERFSQTNIIMS